LRISPTQDSCSHGQFAEQLAAPVVIFADMKISRMKHIFTLVAIFPVLAFGQTTFNVAVFGGGTGNPVPQYDPQFLTIDIGDEVVWDNTQGKHNVYGELDIFPNNPEGFSSGLPAFAPWTFSHTFSTPGVYNYHCTQGTHSNTQFGTITVVNPNSIDESNLFSELQLYPVPSNDLVTMDLGNVIPKSVEVFTVEGRTVTSVQVSNASKQSIDIAHLEPGHYLLRIVTTDGEVGTVRFARAN
jgi:plastocyanin